MHNAPRELAIRWFEEVWNKSRREAIAEMLLPDSVLHDGPKDSFGPEGFYAFFDRLHAACSGIHVHIEQTVVENDCACVRWRVTMKHTGDGLGMPPTGRALEATGISMLRVSEDKLVEGWQNWDMLGLLQQIQAAEQPTSDLLRV